MTPLPSTVESKQKQKRKINKSPEQAIQNKYCASADGSSTKRGQEYEKRINNANGSMECNALDMQTTDKGK